MIKHVMYGRSFFLLIIIIMLNCNDIKKKVKEKYEKIYSFKNWRVFLL